MPKVNEIYIKLLTALGKQHWWPADTPFEIIVGAILTQQTSWRNVEKAINSLKLAKRLKPISILRTSDKKLYAIVRSSGYYKQKTKKLKIFCEFFIKEYGGSIRKMKTLSSPISHLRSQLLSLWGIGRETADSILLYALDKPVFVVDAYTIRIGERVGLFRARGYERVRFFFESNLRRSVPVFKEYHALLVELGKNYCKTKPLCKPCPIKKLCNFGRGV
jgi:endonuclease-3 related protein